MLLRYYVKKHQYQVPVFNFDTPGLGSSKDVILFISLSL